MTAWIYILAWQQPNEDGLTFQHRVVMAETETEAYTKGNQEATAAGLFPLPGAGNDYVIQLVPA